VQRISDAELKRSQRDPLRWVIETLHSTPRRELKDLRFSVRCAQNFRKPSIRTQIWTLLPM